MRIVLQFRDQRPGILILLLLAHLRHHRIGLHAEDRQWTHDADGRFLGCHYPRDGARDVVFQFPLTVQAKENGIASLASNWLTARPR